MSRLLPILYNTPMVRALLDGVKTETRRLIKPGNHTILRGGTFPGALDGPKYGVELDNHGVLVAPYQKGDILYVRETWAENTIPHSSNYAGIEYRADYYGGKEPILRWRPSIHMPKEAARIFLRVTDVRAERLQDIKSADCVSEGAVKRPDMTKRGDLVLHSRYRMEFADLWDSTIAPAVMADHGWGANPWVWVICFERIGKEEAS